MPIYFPNKTYFKKVKKKKGYRLTPSFRAVLYLGVLKGYCISKVSLHPETRISDKGTQELHDKITKKFKKMFHARVHSTPLTPGRG